MLDKTKTPATIDTSVLQEKALLVSLSIGRWSASKTDKSATDKVHADSGAKAEAGRYRKSLLPKEANKPITKLINEARVTHYHFTLSWSDNGQRILNVSKYMDYQRQMTSLQVRYETAVGEFCADFTSNLQEARAILGDLFDANDYPDVEQVRAAHSFKVEVMPLPSADDFRVDLGTKEMARIRKDTEARLQAAQSEAMKDVYLRIHKAVSAMAERLGDPKAIFHDTLVGNLESLVDIMPALNISDDPVLTELSDAMHQRLTVHSPAVLRSNGKARAETAREAKQLLAKVSEYTDLI